MQNHVDKSKDTSGDILRAMLDTAGIGFFRTTAAGRFVDANHAMAHILGYRDAAAILAAGRDLAIHHYVDPGARKHLMEILRRDGQIRKHAVVAQRLDGTEVRTEVSAHGQYDQSGALSGLVGTVADVTDLVTAQETLQETATEYRRIFDSATEGMYRSSRDGRQLRANAALVALNGYDTEEEMLAAVNDIATEWYVEPGRRRQFTEAIESTGRVQNFESEIYRHKTRERIWVRENAWLVRDEAGNPLFYEGTVQDITERRNAELAREESEARFRDFAMIASDWMWETDSEHRFSFVSDAIAAFRFDPTCVLGKTRRELALEAGTEGDVAQWEAHEAELDKHRPYRDFRYKLFNSEGGLEHISVSGKPLFNDDGSFRGYRGVTKRITQSIRNEARLRGALRDADEANAAKSRFLANMSHELRTPLNAVIGFAELIRSEAYGPIGNSRYADYLNDIHHSAQLLLRLIDDVLDLSKAEAGRLELNEERIDLGEICAAVSHMVRHRVQSQELKIGIDVPRTLPALHADRTRLLQILVNLLTNAIKASPVGAVIHVRAGATSAGGLSIEVADRGVGMTRNEVEQALQPFVQIRRRDGTSAEGTGLGLPLCKELVERHSGELTLESQPGHGTIARVTFPASRTLVGVRVEEPVPV
jgi:PAS domain S-box-containing protein